MTSTSIKAFSPSTQSRCSIPTFSAISLRLMAQGIWWVLSQVVVENRFPRGLSLSVCPITHGTRNLGWALSKDLLRVPEGEQASMQVCVSWAVASGSPLLFSSQSPAVSCCFSSDTQGVMALNDVRAPQRRQELHSVWGVGCRCALAMLPVIGGSGQTPYFFLFEFPPFSNWVGRRASAAAALEGAPSWRSWGSVLQHRNRLGPKISSQSLFLLSITDCQRSGLSRGRRDQWTPGGRPRPVFWSASQCRNARTHCCRALYPSPNKVHTVQRHHMEQTPCSHMPRRALSV